MNKKPSRAYDIQRAKYPKTNKSTKIVEIDETDSNLISNYPYCAIPEHYFDRQLALAEGRNPSMASVERR